MEKHDIRIATVQLYLCKNMTKMGDNWIQMMKLIMEISLNIKKVIKFQNIIASDDLINDIDGSIAEISRYLNIIRRFKNFYLD